jgi:hypothetical protein
MPYSIEERNQLDLYKSLVSELRNKHINEIKDSISSLPRFRDSEGVLQSFEDIISTEGLESAKLEGSLYSNVLFNHNMEGMTESEQDESAKYYDAIRNSMLTLQDTKLKKYTKSELLNNTVNRDFTELDKETESELPTLPPRELTPEEQAEADELRKLGIEVSSTELKNGDIVTVEVGNNMRIWLIQDNKKRRFITKEDFYSSRYSDAPIKKLSLDFIKSIDDGKIIVSESQAPYGTSTTVVETVIVNEPYSTTTDL